MSDRAAAVNAYSILGDVPNGLLLAAICAAGWSTFLWGWAALSAKALPRLLTYLVLLAGVVAFLTFLIPLLGILGPVLNIVWSLWLGVVLLQTKKP